MPLLRKFNLLLFLFFSVLILSPTNSASSPASKKQDQIKKLENKLSQEREKFKAFYDQEKDLLAKLTKLEAEVEEAKCFIKKSEKIVHKLKEETRRLKRKLGKSEKRLIESERRLSNRLNALYKYARRGYLSILTDVNDIDQFRKRLKYLKAIMEEDRQELDKLAVEKRKHEKEVNSIKERLTESESRFKEEHARITSLREELEDKVILLMKIHKEKEYYEIAVKELMLAAKNLRETFVVIEKKGMNKKQWHSRFKEAKGKLPLPINGKLIRPDKFLKSARGAGFQKGIFIESKEDRDVRAVYPGRVDFAGQLKGYGEMIIINHGSRFFTILGNITQSRKKEGDEVEEGEVIGLAGLNRSTQFARVYFEIRHGDKDLNPLEWLKIN